MVKQSKTVRTKTVKTKQRKEKLKINKATKKLKRTKKRKIKKPNKKRKSKTATKKHKTKKGFVRYFNDDYFEYENSWLANMKHPDAMNEEDCGYLVYLVRPTDLTYRAIYVGSTNNFPRRQMQHNGIKSGGGVATRRWTVSKMQAEPINIVTGFKSRHDCLVFERFVQKLKVSKFKEIDLCGASSKDESGMATQISIRKLLIALNYKRWSKYGLQLTWFDRRYRPENVELNVTEKFEDPLCFIPK